MSLLIPGTNSIKDTGYNVANSLRFNGASSDDLVRTPSSSGNNNKNTLSVWLKRSKIGEEDFIIYGLTSSANRCKITFLDNDKLQINTIVSSSNSLVYETTRKFRDLSAWYHIVIAFDSTLSTAGDRVRLYINGTEETSFSTETHMGQNTSNFLSTSGTPVYIGSQASGNYFDGYMAEFVFIDGQQLDATSFGEFDSDSPTIWKPKDVSELTFGTNGFYLDFENASSLGADVSGNSNNFTVNNLTSVDQSLDTCTNNACTWNPLRVNNDSGTLRSPSFDNGNLRAIFDDSGNNELAFGSIGVDTGKWFCEMKAEDITATGNTRIGVLDMDYTGTGNPADQSSSVSYLADGQKRVGGSNSSYGASYTSGDIIGVALDVTNNTVTFYKNGSSQGSISITANTLYTFYCEDYASSGNREISANFSSPAYSVSSGNSDANGYGNFEYAVPSGYYTLNTKNLAEFG